METTATHKIIRSRRRSLALVVTDEATVVVRAPWRASEESIARFLADNAEWLRRKLKEMAARPRPQPKTFVPGEGLLFLGASCRLRFGDGEVRLENGEVVVPSGPPSRCRLLVTNWYRQQALRIFQERVRERAFLMGVAYNSLRLSDAKSRWGSCSGQDSLNFSWRLVMAPLPVIDYVIVHELAHIRHKNHSTRFWALVRRFMPDYQSRRKWLTKHGHELTL